MDLGLKERVALVTGAPCGLGRATCLAFAAEGAHVAVHHFDKRDEATALCSYLGERFSVRAAPIYADITQEADCEALFDAAVAAFGRVDILVNNAGITKDNLLMRMSDAEWDAVLAVNLKGPFNCTKAVVRPMFKAQKGRIINIASIVGLMGNAGQANYAASKGGLVAMTKTCAREFASRKVLVNAIAPGFIRTAMTDKLTEDQKKKLTDLIPLARLGEAQDVANTALFLASEESSYITGHVISVNGGMYM
jgi:3-oxoacyl-[acyl-carrier protein] reductase